MSLRPILVSVLLLAATSPARAQDAQVYILGEAAGSFGDGGAAPAAAVGVGYLTPRRIGFEIELSYVADLDFGDPGYPRIAIYPPISIEASGRMVGLQTNVIAVLPGGGTRLRAFVLGGGGVADLQHRIRVQAPALFRSVAVFPVCPGVPPLPDFAALSTALDAEYTRSETALVLSAGAGFEYAVTRRLGAGLSVRYLHLFSDPGALDLARVGARLTWRF